MQDAAPEAVEKGGFACTSPQPRPSWLNFRSIQSGVLTSNSVTHIITAKSILV